MDSRKKKILIGIGIGIALYFVLNKVLKANIDVKPIANSDESTNFSGSTNGYVAKRYDATHINEDGSMGATWVAYNDSEVVGFWKKGKVAIGTSVAP